MLKELSEVDIWIPLCCWITKCCNNCQSPMNQEQHLHRELVANAIVCEFIPHKGTMAKLIRQAETEQVQPSLGLHLFSGTCITNGYILASWALNGWILRQWLNSCFLDQRNKKMATWFCGRVHISLLLQHCIQMTLWSKSSVPTIPSFCSLFHSSCFYPHLLWLFKDLDFKY